MMTGQLLYILFAV